MVFIFGLVEVEKNVAGSDGVEVFSNPKVEPKSALHLRFQAGNGQTKLSRQVISTNANPQSILSEFVIFGNGTKLHQTTIGLRPIGRDELVLGRSVDKLGAATRETGIAKVVLELGDIVERRRRCRRSTRECFRQSRNRYRRRSRSCTCESWRWLRIRRRMP